MKQATYLLSSLETPSPFKNKEGRVLPEIALVGKSNVGKSSLINHLLRRKDLAKVSAKPGKTQTINYFNIDNRFILVDLPGYGYAERAHEMKLKWSAAIDNYLQNRSSLIAILLLIDIRRGPSDEDLAFKEWAAFQKKPVLIIFTKSDTINGHDRKRNIELALLKLKVQDHVLYSTKEAIARNHLIAKINGISQ